jgi:serine/threonine-protein kinase
MLLGAISNALDIQFIPSKIRAWWQTGIRDRLWKSRLGEWVAKRLGAPERSQLAGASAFRATEAALGVAASELFAALPKEWREQLSDLPATVASLEARAAEARAEIEEVAALSASGNAELLSARLAAAKSRLADSVAALEGIRLDLLRLHAGASDLAPLTTLMDAVRLVGEDMNRLAEAQHEVESAVRNR